MSLPEVSLPPCSLLVVLVSSVVELLGAFVLVGIVLVCTLAMDVVLIVHMLRRLFSMAAGFDRVVLVHSLGLRKLVDLTANKASEEFLGERVRDGFA